MADYRKYISALRKCAIEHENDRTFTGQIIVSDLCRDTADLLEKLEQEPGRDMEEIKEVINCDADAETKCKMISNILTAKLHYFEEPFINKPCISEKVCEHDKNVVLDKIKEEIKTLSPTLTEYDIEYENPVKNAIWEILAEVLYIIDEYREENEKQ